MQRELRHNRVDELKVELRTDGAATMRAIHDKVRTLRTTRGQSTLVTNGRPHDTQSMGLVERSVRTLKEISKKNNNTSLG